MKKFPDDVTYGQKYKPAMQITDQNEAADYFELCVEHCRRMAPKLSEEEAIALEKQNLGYFSGYYGEETQRRVEQLFLCVHPYFGPVDLTPGLTLEEGVELGKQIARNKDFRPRYKQPTGKPGRRSVTKKGRYIELD